MEEVIKVDHQKGWVSLNLIGSASVSVPTGMFIIFSRGAKAEVKSNC